MGGGRFRLFRKSVFLNFLISYAIVFMLPLSIVYGVLYQSNISIVEKEIYLSADRDLEQYRDHLDDKIRRISHMLFVLDENSRLSRWIGVDEGGFSRDDRLDAKGFIDDITPYAAANNFIRTLYVYSLSNGQVISSNNTNSREFAWEEAHVYNRENLSFDSWNRMMNMSHRGDLITIPQKGEEDSFQNRRAYYLQSLPFLYSQIPEATAVIGFSLEFLTNRDNPGHEYLMLLNSSGELIYADEGPLPIELPRDKLTGGQGHFTLNGFFVNYLESDKSFTLLSVIPESEVMGSLKRTRLVFWLTLLSCLILGGGLTYYFTVRNFNPFKQLVAVTKHYAELKSRPPESVGTLSDIGSSLLEAVDEILTYEDYFRVREKDDLEKGFIESLIQKRLPDDIAEKLDFPFNDSSYHLVKITFTDVSSTFFAEKESFGEPRDISLEAYGKLLCEMIAKWDQTLPVLIIRHSWSLYMFIGSADREGETVSELRRSLEECQLFMRDNYALDSYAGFSEKHRGSEDLTAAYEEVRRISEYFNLMGEGSVLSYGDMEGTNLMKRLEKSALTEERLLLGCIKNGDFPSARKILDDIYHRVFEEIRSPKIIRIRLFALANSIVDTFLTMDIPHVDKFMEELSPFSRILECANARGLHRELTCLLEDLETFFSREENNLELELKKHIKEIVDSNYSDPNINVSYVARATGKSLDYISRYFKKNARMSLLDYIHMKRIDKAKELICGSDETMANIARRVGYTSTDTFIRVFRKIEGVTPGRYKKNLS